MATQILALSSSDLATLIHQEAMDNPALEVDEHPYCLTCGRALQNGCCQECRFRGRTSAQRACLHLMTWLPGQDLPPPWKTAMIPSTRP